jgi:hypothetical protein
MALETENRHYPIPDQDAVPDESVTDAIVKARDAVLMIDADIFALLEALNGKAPTSHTHTIPQVDGLAAALEGKMDATKTFKLDDLTDVDGADAAQDNYVLVKTPSGAWVAQAASSALGDHEHSISQIINLTDELTARQLTSQKGQASGYASLDASGKVPTTQIPAAVVGAAMAGGTATTTPADGDRFAGVLAGAATVFYTTWANIKAALSALFVSKAGDTMTGPLAITGNTPQLTLTGSSNYISLVDNSGTAAATRHIHHNDGQLGFLNNAGGWMFRMTDNGALWTSQLGDFNTYWEGRCGAHQNAAVNRSVTASRMAGFTSVQPGSNSGVWENSGYVITYMQRLQSDAYVFGARQPQLFIANIGWFAAFPF